MSTLATGVSGQYYLIDHYSSNEIISSFPVRISKFFFFPSSWGWCPCCIVTFFGSILLSRDSMFSFSTNKYMLIPCNLTTFSVPISVVWMVTFLFNSLSANLDMPFEDTKIIKRQKIDNNTEVVTIFKLNQEHFQPLSLINNSFKRWLYMLCKYFTFNIPRSPIKAILGTRTNSHYVEFALSESDTLQKNSLTQCDISSALIKFVFNEQFVNAW